MTVRLLSDKMCVYIDVSVGGTTQYNIAAPEGCVFVGVDEIHIPSLDVSQISLIRKRLADMFIGKNKILFFPGVWEYGFYRIDGKLISTTINAQIIYEKTEEALRSEREKEDEKKKIKTIEEKYCKLETKYLELLERVALLETKPFEV